MLKGLILVGVFVSLWINSAMAEVLVFAAASTTQAVEEVGTLFTQKGLGTVKASFASSSTVAKQIAQGAPANLFISADVQWADYLDKQGLLAKGTRIDLLGNSLVLIAPVDSKLTTVTIDGAMDFDALLDHGRLAVGDPDHVPAGIYARQAFEKLGVWAKVEPSLARADSVRAAMALVERGEAPLGVVYASDAVISKKVKVVGQFSDQLADPIIYPAALITGFDTPEARKLLDFMKSAEARAIFAKYGFKVK